MPASYAAAFAAALLAITWLLGRRRVPLIRDVDTSAVAALNRAQIALVQQGGVEQPSSWPPAAEGRPVGSAMGQRPAGLIGRPAQTSIPDAETASAVVQLPGRDARRRHEFNRTLQADYRSGGASRLNAVRAARQWGDRATLPLLRQALRDPDPAVVLEAAAAIERFRGRPTQPRPEAGRAVERQALPRRVARTR